MGSRDGAEMDGATALALASQQLSELSGLRVSQLHHPVQEGLQFVQTCTAMLVNQQAEVKWNCVLQRCTAFACKLAKAMNHAP